MKLIIAIVNSEDASRCFVGTDRAGLQRNQTRHLRRLSACRKCHDDDRRGGRAGAKSRLSVIEEFSSQRKQQVPVNSTYIGDSMITVPVEVTVGGATVFVLDVEQFYKL